MPHDPLNEWRHRRVVLRSFRGTDAPAQEVPASDDYWRLIGQAGFVLELELDTGRKMAPHEPGRRALVRFDTDLRKHGLACHNPVPNSLWCLLSDLERLPAGGA